MKNPLLSICIPTYNRAHYLKDCLISIQTQFDENKDLLDLVEVVISDNASTDNTKEVAQSYAPIFNNFLYVSSEKNVGFDLNIVNVITNATGKYCWYLADDDVLINGSIDYIVKKLQTNEYDVITVGSHPVTGDDYKTRKVFNDTDIFETTNGDDFLHDNNSLGGVSNLIFNREQWMKCLTIHDYLTWWLYNETVVKIFLVTDKKMLNVLQTLVYTGQDCRWSENGAELTTFVNSNLMIERMIGFGFNKARIDKLLYKNRRRLPIMLLRAKGHGLVCNVENLKFMYKNLRKVGIPYLALATIIYFTPNFIVKIVRDVRKYIIRLISTQKKVPKFKNLKKGLAQRLFYIKNAKYGFSIIFLLPGSLREKIFGENTFFRTLTKNNKDIHLQKTGDSMMLKAGHFALRFPMGCFYETDFFDIMYPRLNLHDPLIEHLVYKNPFYVSEGSYEKFGVVLSEGDYVLDAGANIGMFSIIASHAIGAHGKVFAFEPLKEISDVLEENEQSNNCANIIIENKILGEVNKEVEFFYNLDSNYNAASKTIKHDGDKVVLLEQVTLDEYVRNNNIIKIDFIKADIEGAERDLLKGGEETIKKFKPKLALRTYHLPDDKEVLYNLVKKYVPEYNIRLDNKTLYAWI